MTITSRIRELLVRSGLFENTLKLSITTFLLVLTVGVCYYLYLRKRNRDIKRANDIRMRKIREKQMSEWEQERSERLLNSDSREKEYNYDSDEEDGDKDKERKHKSSSFGRSNNYSHLNPHFSYISTYKPSVSKRYPCKKCCG
ncbi:hypothetical protein FG386_002282 [Cryptosporidium ryanae]|uniref:uncharacterized protein n=1 Tax=Cryptosporidium ryanae TaxID=515981 RepID=UPI00351A91C8|nr:hypothetical protein FG386_002282 [Cryptosporidium ryanae]